MKLARLGLVVALTAACVDTSDPGEDLLGPGGPYAPVPPPTGPVTPNLGPEGFRLGMQENAPYWTADSARARHRDGGAVEITAWGPQGGDERAVIVLRLTEPQNIGPTPLDRDGNGSEFTFTLPDRGSHEVWSTWYYTGLGTVTVTQLSTDRIAGVFSIEAESMSGSAERLYSWAGQFNVKF
jgi:Family of unknown function (DUF6252)